MKNYFIFIFSLLAFNVNAQEYRWTGNSNNNDFFDELNWVEFISNNIPEENSINPGQPIGFSLYLTCEIIANGEIILNENGKIIITDGELNSEKISGFGEIILNNSAYLNLTDIDPIFEGISVNFNSNESWIRFYNLDPSSAFYYYHDNIFYNNQQLSYPEDIRFDNYYNEGSIVRINSDEFSNLTVFSENSLSGESANIINNTVFEGESIPNNLNDDVSSFKLNKGYMATFAENEDGTGKSKVFIASENDIIINILPEYLDNKISFIRVIPWNWVTKKGTAGDTESMNNNWFYKWSNNGSSDMSREYAPMAWGKGAADDLNDIEIIKQKYKSTHLLAFNEPDNCNDQSGQYGNMCVVDTSLVYYKNLLKTGLRMVSPATRQGEVFSWLNEFNYKAENQEIRIDVIAVHWYDWTSNPENSPNANPQDIYNRFVNYLENVYNLYGLPIWITEFNANRYRNEWVHRQFLQLALPYLEETEYIERYSFFPPVTDQADFFDENNNYTQIGEFYSNFNSTKSMAENEYASPSNLNSNDYEFTQTECNPNNAFLSNHEIESQKEITIYPNPSNDYVFIEFDQEITDLKILNIEGRIIKKLRPVEYINVSFLNKGIYFLKVNDHFIKFIKK
ncbi:MAG: glycosyl hydrolase [Flavobacteriaceae bacterium]